MGFFGEWILVLLIKDSFVALMVMVMVMVISEQRSIEKNEKMTCLVREFQEWQVLV